MESVKLFCIGYYKLNELQKNNTDINDPIYLECLNYMKLHQLPNHIKLPPQYNNLFRRINNKHIILVKENQIKSLAKQMHTVQTTQYIDLLDIVNNNNSESFLIKKHYQQLFLQIQTLKQQIQQLNKK
ncbi:hypothetical protein ACTFIR_009713 [Dictyostelium discoideum]